MHFSFKMFRFLVITTLASFQIINGNAAISMMSDNEPSSFFKRRSARSSTPAATTSTSDSEDSRVPRAGPSSSSLSKAAEPMSTDDVKASTTTSSKFPSRTSFGSAAVKTTDDTDADALPAVRKPFSSSSSSLRGSSPRVAEPMYAEDMNADKSEVSSVPRSKSSYSSTISSSKSVSAAEPLDLSATKSSTTSSLSSSSSFSRLRSADDDADVKVQKMITIGRAQATYIDTLKGYLQLLKDTRESKVDDKEIDNVQEKLKKVMIVNSLNYVRSYLVFLLLVVVYRPSRIRSRILRSEWT